MHTITVKSLQFRGHHGVHEDERRKGTLFELDVMLTGDFTKAAESDDIHDAVDYEQIGEITAGIVEGPSRQLIETLCMEIGKELLNLSPHIRKLEVALRKLSPQLRKPAAWTEIRMQWNR